MMEKLRTQLVERRFAEAHALASSLLAEQPESLDLLHLSAIAFARVGQVERARELFEQALLIAPEDSVLHLNLAQLHLAKGELGDARQAYKNAAILDPNLSPAHTALADFAVYDGNAAAAEELYLTALRADRNAVPALIGQAHLLLNRNALAEAMPLAQRALKLAENSARAHALMGRCLLLNGNQAFALRALQNATKLEPRFYAAKILRAQAELAIGDLAAAEATLADAAKSNANEPNLRLTRAELYLRKQRLELAYGDLEMVLSRAPENLAALRALTRIDLEQGAPERALRRLEQLAEQHPGNTEIALECLGLQRELNLGQRALSFARAWSVKAPSVATAQSAAAAMEEAFGEIDAVTGLAERALAIHPQQIEAALVLSRARLKHGRPGEALNLLNALRTQALPRARSVELERIRGRAFDALGDRQGAADSWQQAARLAVKPAATWLPKLAPPELRAALPELAVTEVAANEPTLVFLIGLPSSGVEALVWWLHGTPAVSVMHDRFGPDPRRDLLNFPADPRLDEAFSSSDLEQVRRRYLRALRRLRPRQAPSVIVDWLPSLDVRQYRVFAAALPQARWLVVERDPRDCLLSSIVNGAQGLPLTDLSESACLLHTQQLHLRALADLAGPALLRFTFEQAAPRGELEKLSNALAFSPVPSDERWRAAISILGGLPQHLGAERWQAYEKPFKEAFELCSPG